MRAIRDKSKMTHQELAVYCEALELRLVQYKKKNKRLAQALERSLREERPSQGCENPQESAARNQKTVAERAVGSAVRKRPDLAGTNC